MKILTTTLLSILILSNTLFAETEGKPGKGKYLGLFSKKEKVYIVGTGKDAIEIKRTMTPCAKNRGVFQPFEPVKGVTPVTEADILIAMNDRNSLIVDVRKEDQYKKSTLPTAINIPFTEIELRLDEVGCEEGDDDKLDCSKAPNVYSFCNGPVCAQSPIAMKKMVENGFPAEKIFYYRGGVLNWAALGLTMVPGK